jgi:predicted membrane metal-binding protein
MFRSNLLPHKREQSPPRSVRVVATVGYFLCLSILFSWCFPSQRVATSNPLSSFAQHRTQMLIPSFRNPELAANFLSNTRDLPKDLSEDMKSSGVSHLLAISGAQVAFLLPLFSTGILRPIGVACSWWIPAHALMTMLGFLRALIENIVAILCAALFGATGSLTRVVVLRTSAKNFRFLTLAGKGISLYFPNNIVLRTLLVTLCALWLGNPFANLSFLLSALGAAVAQGFSRGISRKNLAPWQSAGWITIATSFSMSVVLAPVFSGNPIHSVFANLVAIPIVTWAVTPLSMFLLLGPPKLIENYAITALDLALDFFRCTAQAFASNAPDSFQPLQPTSATAYLSLCLAVLWAVEDLRDCRHPLSNASSIRPPK